MIKQAELNKIKQAAFQDELEKLAWVSSVGRGLFSIGRLFGKTNKIGRMATRGGKYLKRNPNVKFRTAYRKGLDSMSRKLPYKDPMGNLGKKPRALPKSQMASGFDEIETMGSKMRGMLGLGGAKNYKKVRTFFGAGGKGKVVGMAPKGTVGPSLLKNPVGFASHQAKQMGGQAVHNLRHIERKGLGSFLKKHWKDHKYYTRTNRHGQTIQVQRSALGRVVNPALTSGIGFGALEALPSTTETGARRTVAGRATSGAATAAKWSVAPHLMGTKLMLWDMPKAIFKGGSINTRPYIRSKNK